jgi:2-dehydro-3-deoxygluconokinase
LWQRFGGKEKAKEVNRMLLPYVDVLFGIEELERNPEGLETELFRQAILKTAEAHPQLKTIVSTMRIVKSANVNDWSGLLWHEGEFHQGVSFENLEIYDRVGAGDAFAAGIIHGRLEDLPLRKTIDYGVVHGALTMTTPGDNSMFSLAELDRTLATKDAGVLR